MSLTFTCPHCGVVSEIEPSHVGRTGPCRSCGKEVTVPLPKESQLPPSAATRGSSAPWLIGCAAIVGGGVLLLGVLACAGAVLFGVRSQQIRTQEEIIRLEVDSSRRAEEMARQMELEAQQRAAEAERLARELEESARKMERELKETPPP